MRKIYTFIILFMFSFKCYSQGYQSSFVSASMAVGTNKNGIVECIESGIWNVDRPLSFYAGISAYNGNAQPKSSSQPLLYDVYGRLCVKLHKDPVFGFFNVATAYVSARGDVGATYRLYYQVGRNCMIGAEPGYSLKNKQALSFLVTVSF